MEFLAELNQIMAEIKYGWVDTSGQEHTDLVDFAQLYSLQSPEELLISKLGVCWDQVELERTYLENHNQTARAFNIIHYPDSINPKMRTHTFILFDHNNQTYWYEHAWEKRAGLHDFSSQSAALKQILTYFISDELNDNCDQDYIAIYEYPAPPSHIGADAFYGYCESNGRKIILEP